jgi:hypothetical protein
VGNVQGLYSAEQAVVFRVGSGPTGLDVIDAKLVEFLGYEALVIKRKTDILRLRPIP